MLRRQRRIIVADLPLRNILLSFHTVQFCPEQRFVFLRSGKIIGQNEVPFGLQRFSQLCIERDLLLLGEMMERLDGNRCVESIFFKRQIEI